MSSPDTSPPTVSPASWLPTLQLATEEVFELMLGARLKIAHKSSTPEGLDITCLVGLAGQIRALLSIRCSTKSAAHMAARMLGIAPEKAEPQMWDAIGEVGNLVAGNFKNKIPSLDRGCMLSVPTVMSGTDYRVHSMVNDKVQLAFLFEGDLLLVCLEVHR